MLAHVVRSAGQVQLETPQGPRAADEWLAALQAQAPSPTRPRPSEKWGPADILPGRLLFDHPLVETRRPSDRVLLAEGGEVRLLTGPTLDEQWRFAVDDPNPLVLLFDQERLLLWVGGDGDDARALMLDVRTGTGLWSTPPLRRHLGQATGQQRLEQEVQLMQDGQPFNARQTLPLVDRDRLYLVQRSGGMAAFELRDGSAPIWTASRTIDQVHLAQTHDCGLVLAGTQSEEDPLDGERGQVSRIVVLDPESGRLLHLLRPPGRGEVQWMQIGPLGTLVYATSAGLHAAGLLSGRPLWSNTAYAAANSRSARRAGDHVILEDGKNDLRTLDMHDGSLSAPFALPSHGSWDPLDIKEVRIVDGRIYVRYRQRVVRFDEQGTVGGADIVTDERSFEWLIPVADGLLVVSQYGAEQVPVRAGGGGGRRTMYTYRVYHLSENCKLLGEHELPPIPQPLFAAQAIDGWLLLSSQLDTLAIPMPPEE
jgi:hypothetical protein